MINLFEASEDPTSGVRILSFVVDRDTYIFNFNDRFEMHDDVEVLKRSGLALGLQSSGQCRGADLQRALILVNVNLQPYVIGL